MPLITTSAPFPCIRASIISSNHALVDSLPLYIPLFPRNTIPQAPFKLLLSSRLTRSEFQPIRPLLNNTMFFLHRRTHKITRLAHFKFLQVSIISMNISSHEIRRNLCKNILNVTSQKHGHILRRVLGHIELSS